MDAGIYIGTDRQVIKEAKEAIVAIISTAGVMENAAVAGCNALAKMCKAPQYATISNNTIYGSRPRPKRSR